MNAPARRLLAIVRKESLQILRDPSTLLIAFVLPVVLLFLYTCAVSLDVREVADALVAGRLRGYVLIPQDFAARLHAATATTTTTTTTTTRHAPLVQIVTDGAQPNTAGFVANYAQGVVNGWMAGRADGGRAALSLEPRFWFNPELESRRTLVPGAIAVVMTMIGTLLTALVVAREWERGTMEGLFSTPASTLEILTGKLLPYFVLGLATSAVSVVLATGVFGVPLRGAVLTLLFLSAVFMIPALGQGLLISVLARNQFVAAQVALLTGFMPAFLLSGFLFEIDSMPAPVRAITYLVAARYFNTGLRTVFLTGDVWPLLWPQIAAMFVLGLVFFLAAKARTRKSLEP
ncbi:MAG: ABC transporter permease subunit [Azoarcus sp.]|jgi:ABC-2 type transport system permease protein|nr:ABC transporter permease subunit [Azoarcus sp.]